MERDLCTSGEGARIALTVAKTVETWEIYFIFKVDNSMAKSIRYLGRPTRS
jgi:hypothetical protein